MSANEFDATRDDMAEALRQASLATEYAKTRVERLACQAFEDGDKASRVFHRLLRDNGAETTVAALTGDRQRWHFGFQRQPFLGFGASRNLEVRQALKELPEAIRSLAVAQTRLSDLRTMSRKMERPAERRRTNDEAPAMTHTRGRSRT
jgi:hypothetical protein